jgi:hypothetical protein
MPFLAGAVAKSDLPIIVSGALPSTGVCFVQFRLYFLSKIAVWTNGLTSTKDKETRRYQPIVQFL